MTCGIYLITNKINGHMYVGQSTRIEDRFNEHRQHHDLAIDKAILKYGSNNFTYDIIEELPNDINILHEREMYWIKFYNTYEDRKHYNLTPGGEGVGSGENHPCYIHLDNNTILEKARSGMSPIEIGKELGVKGHLISRRLQKMMSNNEYEEYKKNNYKQDIQARITRSKEKNTSGYLNVCKYKRSDQDNSIIWQYKYYEDNKRKSLYSKNLEGLKEKVLAKGLPWIKI